MVITRSLEGVFEEDTTIKQSNLNDPSKVASDEPPQPMQYIMAGNAGPYDKTYPERATRKADYLNAGFVVFKPSMEMYDHYIGIANIEGRYNGEWPEQNLWNYVHRRDGNMPWKEINANWTVNSPIGEDYERGVASMHEKYWRCHACKNDRKLGEILMKSRWKAEGFYNNHFRNQISSY